MSRRTRTIAVALSAAAFAAGTAGPAQAHDGTHHGFAAHAWFHHHHGHGLARAAHALGVSKDALKAAIAGARDDAKAAYDAAPSDDPAAQRKAAADAFFQSVAAQLNLPQDEVQAALTRDHGGCDH
jgi:hypothetical protein